MRKRILVIDDDASVLDAMDQVLGYHNYAVRATPPPEDINGLVSGFQPDLLLIDYLLLPLDGASLVRIIKDDPGLQNLPVIMISAYGQQIPAGVSDTYDMLLEKPFDMNEMLQAIDELI